MQKKIYHSLLPLLFFALISGCVLTGCKEDDPTIPYILTQEDIQIVTPENGFAATIGQPFKIEVETVSDEGVTYQWYLNGAVISQTKNLEYTFKSAGEYDFRLIAKQGELTYEYTCHITVSNGKQEEQGPSAYITKVLDFMPAVGQFTNTMPEYEEGDTQESMNAKVLKAIGNGNRGMISLGGFGGYVVVGFDHTIENVSGKRDFRVLGNAFDAAENPSPNAPEGGSCEPGVIMVAYDANKNGIPDDDEWYEIAGSSHHNPAQELWYQKAVDNGNDVDILYDYEITYYRPQNEPATEEERDTYIRWEDNRGNSGYKVKNIYHDQCYYPLWAGDELTLKGTRLPQNGIDEGVEGNYYFVLYKFLYGYADNATNNSDESAIDIDWAVDKDGNKANLPGVDFIRIHTGVNQENGWLGECSTEISGVEDLHILGIDINTRQ